MNERVTREDIAAFEARVMSVGHGVLSDSEWRRLIDTLEDAWEKVERYRVLRRHVRKDGTIKQAQPKDVAIAAAERMTAKHGKQFDAYPCQLCNGRWHVGHERQPTEDT